MTVYNISRYVEVEITVNDPDAIRRCVENHDENGVPQPPGQSVWGWRDHLYDLRSEEDVLDHWAYNAISNGIEDASRLDGWADLEPGVVTMRIELVSA